MLTDRGVTLAEYSGVQFREALQRHLRSISEDEVEHLRPMLEAERGWFAEHPRYIRWGGGPFPTLEGALVGAISALVKYIEFNDPYWNPSDYPPRQMDERQSALRDRLRASQEAIQEARREFEQALFKRFLPED